MEYLFGFIGVGNMGGALARAACRSAGAGAVAVADRDVPRAEKFAKEEGCAALTLPQLVAASRFILFGVKPQDLDALSGMISDDLRARAVPPTIISMAAGVGISLIKEKFGNIPVIRIMPNIPAAVGEGMVLYTTDADVSDDTVAAFLAGMAAAGRFDRLDEKLMDAGSAISGCGPAFAYMFIEALADGGVKCGLPYDKALIYAAQTLAGAARYALGAGQHPEALKNAVCSPGGSTIAGVYSLESGAFRANVMGAVEAAYVRTSQLGKQ